MSVIETIGDLSFIRLSVKDKDLYAQVLALRNILRVKRGYSYEYMIDGDDSDSAVIFLLTRNGIPVCTGRYLKTLEGYELGKLATESGSQGQGYGTLITQKVSDICQKLLQPGEITYLIVFMDLIKMYEERIGFKTLGDPFIEFGTKWQKMVYVGADVERL